MHYKLPARMKLLTWILIGVAIWAEVSATTNEQVTQWIDICMNQYPNATDPIFSSPDYASYDNMKYVLYDDKRWYYKCALECLMEYQGIINNGTINREFLLSESETEGQKMNKIGYNIDIPAWKSDIIKCCDYYEKYSYCERGFFLWHCVSQSMRNNNVVKGQLQQQGQQGQQQQQGQQGQQQSQQ